MTYFLGLTGGIATGKSTASRFFESKGIPVIDADVIARNVLEPDQPAFKQVVDSFGPAVVTEEGLLDRKALGQLIFADEQKRKRLNEIVQGDIRKRIQLEKNKLKKQEKPLVVLDVPLLYEADYEKEVDEVMVIYIDRSTQLKRLMKRDNISKDEAIDRIKAQDPIEEKAKKADTVIDNSESVEETEKQLVEWIISNGFQVDDINVI